MEFIIWSKDRAAQLYLLLESIDRVFSDFYHKTTVLYTFSDKKYEDGYNECLKFNCDLIKENSFYEDSISILENARPKICLLTDDTVFYSPIDSNEYEQALNFLNYAANNIFSFRLGKNTIIQDHINQTKQIDLVPLRNEDVNYWKASSYPNSMNYGYPFAIDAHLYNKHFLLPKVKSFVWKNTNDLEGGLQKFNKEVQDIGCFDNSRAVNIPYNNISGLTLVNDKNNISLEEANNKFLQGYKIDLRSIEQEKIVGCHQDVNLEWVER
jgi:hypothetical protein